jgi:hypothetical protein
MSEGFSPDLTGVINSTLSDPQAIGGQTPTDLAQLAALSQGGVSQQLLSQLAWGLQGGSIDPKVLTPQVVQELQGVDPSQAQGGIINTLEGAASTPGLLPYGVDPGPPDANGWTDFFTKFLPLATGIVAGPLGAALSGGGALGSLGLGGLSAAQDTALISGLSGAATGGVEGGGLGALLGGVTGGLGSLGANAIGNAIGGALGGSGDLITGGDDGAIGSLGGGGEFGDPITIPSSSSFVNEFTGTDPLGGALGSIGGGAGPSGSFANEFNGTAASGAGGAIPGTAVGSGGNPLPSPGDASGGPEVSEVTVTANPNSNVGLNPSGLVTVDPGSLTQPPSNTFTNNNTQDNPNKDIQNVINKILGTFGSGTGVPALVAALNGSPGAGPGASGGGGGGGGGVPSPTSGGGLPGDISTSGFGNGGGLNAAPPPLVNGSTAAGGGVGPGGAPGLDLKGSLAPDIYPWATSGGL